jgi:hypothetical protein
MKVGLRLRQTDSVAAAAETELSCFRSGNLSNQADIQCRIDANFHANSGDYQNYSTYWSVVIKTESHEHCRTTSLLVVVKAGSGFSQRGAA